MWKVVYASRKVKMNISRIVSHDVNPRFLSLMKQDTSKKVGNVLIESFSNGNKIMTYSNGKQTVIDKNGNVVLTKITEKGKSYLI